MFAPVRRYHVSYQFGNINVYTERWQEDKLDFVSYWLLLIDDNPVRAYDKPFEIAICVGSFIWLYVGDKVHFLLVLSTSL